VAYYGLGRCLIGVNGRKSELALAFGKDIKGRLSIVAYACGIAVSFANPWVALATYVAVAGLWFVPDRRIEAHLRE
jgi:hypothetical protein